MKKLLFLAATFCLTLAAAAQTSPTEGVITADFVGEASMQQDLLQKRDGVFFVRQVQNHAAKQEREKGYCEIVFGGTESFAELKQQLSSLATDMPSLMDEGFLQQAYTMMELG